MMFLAVAVVVVVVVEVVGIVVVVIAAPVALPVHTIWNVPIYNVVGVEAVHVAASSSSLHTPPQKTQRNVCARTSAVSMASVTIGFSVIDMLATCAVYAIGRPLYAQLGQAGGCLLSVVCCR